MTWKAALLSLVITLVFLQNYLFNITKPIDPVHGDTFHTTITLRHYRDLLYGMSESDFLTVPMFYGEKNSLLFSEPFFFEGLLSLPLFLITSNVILVFNILAILTVACSLFSMYLLSHYFTKSFWPSLIAGVIYVFNPFVMGHFPDNLHYYSLYWLPLIILFLEKTISNPKSKNSFFFFVCLTGQLLTSMTFFALLTVILPIYTLTRYLTIKPNLKTFFRPSLFLGLAVFLPILFGIFFLYHTQYPTGIPDRNLESLMLFSPWPSDLIFSQDANLLYGGLRNKLQPIFPNYFLNLSENIERNLFWGLTVITIFIFGLVKRKRLENTPTKLWLSLILITTILSFGIRFSFTYDFGIPAPYLVLAKLHPLINQLRVSSRFYFATYLFLAPLIGSLLTRLPKKLIYLIFPLIILEYATLPWKFTTFSNETRQVYSVIDTDPNITAILELPIGNLTTPISLAKNQFVDSTYMLYASSLHHKSLFNGYSSYLPPAYTHHVEYITMNFPNATKLATLKSQNISAIVLHRDQFNNPTDYDRIKSQLQALGVHQVLSGTTTSLFDLTRWTSPTP